MPDNDLTRRELLALTVLVEGGMAVAACLIGWSLDVFPWQMIDFNLHDAALGLVASLPMFVIFLACVRWPIGPLRSLQRFAEVFLRPLFLKCTIFDLAFISLLAGVGEELFFRGLLQPYFTQKSDEVMALVLTSILFGIFHPLSTIYVILAALLGLFLGWMVLESGNLLPAILAHAAYDFIALVYLVKRRPR